ncbi:semaphorin-4A isoform X1 [Oncorhynchus tshawytscha]|uniref:Sema domain-containing protein n=1 Tax=Oncorhynchus tshawytscha TaxID=74940 RepID=A0A8C8F8K5_ONCTS|nr:semaphorin-4A isoform X1 [Oncorhynchus tshawytscha]XP_024251489.1 semaphorin-4A isoform X1 [Oncorhynchus tshawytscha]XP_024251490.1 semaphorin-4A isoform X1 [Oncorhynchus tshawytscha]XP_024251491.1 semaphorin-4A isoform X1 [Oncorhynchus tshawytscha]XP_042165932.1 semaphorin-4A isoform X1 [Oncorhynchus tshawytscha]
MEHQGLLSIIVVILWVMAVCLARLTPRVSFPMGSPGRCLSHFDSSDVGNTTTLLLSDDGDTLFVGARNAVLSLDVSQEDAIVMRGKLDWSPSEKDLDECSMKGKKKMDCPNFIRVLQFLNSTHMYACGTFAFSPRCTYVNSETFSLVTSPSGKPEEGRGRCPYDPYQRNSAITVDGELYTGTVADYMGNRPVISRHLSEGGHVDLKLDDTLGWLEDPTFISSNFVPSEEKIYFFFSEVGREYDFIDKFTVSRIAQVCTSDVGGQRTLQRRWTTFAKAQLLCQSDNELPYNVIQDIVTLPPPEGAPVDDTLFFGIFSSQWSVNSGQSAVCAFRLGDIKAVFAGNYKVLNRDTLRWSMRVQEKVANPGECGLHNASDNTLRFVKENFLADDSVHPVGQSLTMVSPDQRYSHVVSQRVQAANGKDFTVLFLLTESGYLHKAVLLEKGAHIIEEIQVFEQPQAVKNLLLSKSKGVLFVGSSEGVVRVPSSNCSYYWSCAECVLSRDPFCGWDPSVKVCTHATSIQDNAGQDVEGGNVQEACVSPRFRFGLHKGKADSFPLGELVSVSLNEVVRLQCPEASSLAHRHWERPNSRLSPDLYLQLEDGSLHFLATPATLGHYLCLSTENGFQQNLAIYQVKQKSSPTPQATAMTTTRPQSPALPPTTQAGSGGWLTPHLTGPKQTKPEPTAPARETPVTTRRTSRNFTFWVEQSGETETEAEWWGGEKLLLGQTYLKELVVVSVLLACCVSILLTMTLYSVRQRCRSRTAPQANAPGRDSERGGPQEREALRGGQSPCSNGMRNGQMAHNGQANGVVCNVTPRGSNGHLPNTPI